MKKIMIAALLFAFTALVGCKEEELYELDVADNVAVTEDDKTAENLIDSRPFVVFVCGEVCKPGVYSLDAGSRMMDAVEAAGGYTKDAYENYLNLAGLIEDEQKIYVPSKEEVEVSLSTGEIIEPSISMGEADLSGKIELNSATKEELMTLTGVGESKANKIIEYRETSGPFKKPEEIMQIPGIKEGMFSKIKDSIYVR